ncbi:hypothetical protein C8J57DRAFT_1240567 [Mycena rebaudengoi]|nr:hypothetical protein C8J57DRAFT_1240567 [Mycena rebaudengoi]
MLPLVFGTCRQECGAAGRIGVVSAELFGSSGQCWDAVEAQDPQLAAVGEPEGFEDLRIYWTVAGPILARLIMNRDFGSMDPHIWATDSGLLDLAGARGKGCFPVWGEGYCHFWNLIFEGTHFWWRHGADVEPSESEEIIF